MAQWHIRLWRLNETDSYDYWERTHKHTSPIIYQALVKLQGLWIKIGQYLSTRYDVIPEQYIFQLEKLQDCVPPKSIDINDIVQSEFGMSSDQLFKWFEPTPLATASIAQVHRATLHERLGGRQVVVKIQHKGIERIIAQDLRDLRLIIRTIAFLEPRFNFEPVVGEWTSHVPLELDFINEANNTIRVRDQIKEHNQKYPLDHPLYIECHFADPNITLTTKRLMISTFVEGLKLSQISVNPEIDSDKIIMNIMKAYAFQIYVLGFFNSDPHPGNFLVAKIKNRWMPVLLDFGLCKQLEHQETVNMSRILLSAKHLDFTGLISGLSDLGIKISQDPEESMRLIRFVFRNTTSAEETRIENQRFSLGDQKLDFQNAFPSVLVLFSRVISLLRGLCMALDSRQSYLDIMSPFAQLFLRNSVSQTTKLGLISLTPVNATFLERELIQTVRKLIDDGSVLGIQIAVLKNHKWIVNIAGGSMGPYDPSPVQLDTLFPIFSATKSITSAVLHRLVSRGKAKYDDFVADHWPEFVPLQMNAQHAAIKRKTRIWHILTHSSGLEDAGTNTLSMNPLQITDWEKMRSVMERAVPSQEPGQRSVYHYLSFGWLTGVLCEKISGRPFQVEVRDLLESMGVPKGQAYIGIENGCEQRLATLFWDSSELPERADRIHGVPMPLALSDTTSHQSQSTVLSRKGSKHLRKSIDLASIASSVVKSHHNPMMMNPTLFNDLHVRQAVIPAANGHFSAQALATFFDHFLKVLQVQPPFDFTKEVIDTFIQGHPSLSSGFGYGFRRFKIKDTFRAFGHEGMGGSIGLCVPDQQLSVAITVNKLNLFQQSVTRPILDVIASHLEIDPIDLDLPAEAE
ncbi:beta-lactamase/transpeptidase-like protein [Gorgonomyces haynaldii]|nr:beta-lactamase/transpeptidase-like protein [Gorgonomyces haynaldii]